VRRRVQQEQLGHRGRKHDPLYGIRRLLLRTWGNLNERGWERLRAGLAAGDPDGEVEIRELTRLATTIDRWRDEVLAYHSTAGASNGPTEAVNLLVDKIRRIGHGDRNFTNYRRRLLLGCGITWPTVPTRRIEAASQRWSRRAGKGDPVAVNRCRQNRLSKKGAVPGAAPFRVGFPVQ
jgi:hypothetical protein